MLFPFDPWRTLERMRGELDGLFSRARAVPSSFPLVNVYDSRDDILVTAELPGMKKDNVSITFNDGVLTLAGKREAAIDGEKYTVIREERAVGEFEKSLRIPAKVKHDGISATFKDGVLTVKMEKAEEAKPRQISIDIK